MRAVVFTGAGGNEVIRVEQRPDPDPRGEEVVVCVRYAGLNPADLLQRNGHYPAPPGALADIPGLEVAGTVVACGERVTAWQEGDRVFGLVGGGGLAERVLVHERALVRVPDALDEREAAAVPEAFFTAHDAIRTQAGLELGETLLVQGAAGGVGTAAVQIALAAGARAIGVARSQSGLEAVRGLGAEAIPDEGFAERALALTAGRGVDVILELVGAVHLPGDLQALAPKGRIVVVSTAGGSEAELPLRQLMAKRASIFGTVLRARPLEEKAAVARAFERELSPHFASGRVRPVIDSLFPVERVGEAFERIEERGKIGKVLLDFGA